MQIKTIKIKAADADQGDFVVINLSDFNSEMHTPFDQDAQAELAAAMDSGELTPSVAELRAIHDRLLERERDLNAERERVTDQARTNEVEAQRLADEKAAVDAAKAATEKAAAKAPKPAADDKK